MKILYWTQHYHPYIGGVEVMAVNFIAAMRAAGHEFVVVTAHGSLDLPDEDEVDGVPVYRFPFLQALAAQDAREILRLRQRVGALKRRLQPDLVHFSLTDSSIFFHMQTSAPDTLSLIAVELALPPAAADERTLLGQAFRASDWITANSEAILSDLHAIAPYTVGRSSRIYYGYPLPDTEPRSLHFEPPHLVGLGRLVEEKGFDLALKALSMLRARFPEVRLTIAGDGPARRDLETLAGSLGIAGVVDFVGWVNPEDVPALLNTATVVVMPSRWREAFGIVALQAAQMARPVVAARVGGLPEVVNDGETGLLIEPESPSALAEAVARLLDNPDEATQMGRSGRKWAQAKFGRERYIEEYSRLYAYLMEKKLAC